MAHTYSCLRELMMFCQDCCRRLRYVSNFEDYISCEKHRKHEDKVREGEQRIVELENEIESCGCFERNLQKKQERREREPEKKTEKIRLMVMLCLTTSKPIIKEVQFDSTSSYFFLLDEILLIYYVQDLETGYIVEELAELIEPEY